jgi:hypothetical protein
MTVHGEAGIVHLRLITPPELIGGVLEALQRTPSVHNTVRIEGASIDPAGDLVLCDVAREEVSVVLAELERLGLHRSGSISIEAIDTAISEGALRAEQAAKGSPSDAVVWDEVEARTSESAAFSFSFVAALLVIAGREVGSSQASEYQD